MLNKYQLYLINAKKTKICENFTLFDVCNSDTALLRGFDNRPTPEVVNNATELIKHVIQPIRTHYNKPLTVNCIYRSPTLNVSIGGAASSQHQRGQACDFIIDGVLLTDIFYWVKAHLDFDQLIHEGAWIHVSYVASGKNRKQSLRLVNGKYIAG